MLASTRHLQCLTTVLRLAGPPLTEKSAVVTLAENGVTVGLGIKEVWDARNARFDLAWVRGVLS